MDEIERLFNNIVKLFNSVNIYKKKKISKNWFPFTQKSSKCLQSFDLNYYNSSSMIHVTTSQILYSAKTKPVDDVCRKSLKTKVALINAEIISLCKRRRIWCPLCCTHCIWCAHCFFACFFFLHVLMKSVFRCYGNQSTRYILYFKSRSDLRNATLIFVYFLSI